MTFSAFFPFFAWIYIYPSWTFWCPLCQNAIFIAWGFRFSKIKYYFFFFLDPLETVYLWIKLISNMLSCSTLSVPIGIITITTASNNYALKDPHWLPLHRRYHSHESYLQFPLYFYFENLKIQECLLSNTSKMPLLYH